MQIEARKKLDAALTPEQRDHCAATGAAADCPLTPTPRVV